MGILLGAVSFKNLKKKKKTEVLIFGYESHPKQHGARSRGTPWMGW